MYDSKQTTILITGATGFIGSMLIKNIIDSGNNLSLRLLLIVRDEKKARQQFSREKDKKNVDMIYIETSIEKLNHCTINWDIDYIIHCASPTKSAYLIANPVEAVESIVIGTRNVLELARKHSVKSMVYLSSMEVYGNINCDEKCRVTEDEMGYINTLNVRSCYPLGKRMAENLCFSYYKEYGVAVKIARLSQIFGRGILPDETRVFAQFVKAAQKGENIVLHTSGNSIGNYCDIDDAIEAIFLLLYKGKNGEAYNIVNEKNTMTIRQMAELVAGEIANGKIKVVYDIPEENIYGYAAETGVRLSSQKIEKLGWKPKADIKTMYLNMLDYIQ